MTCDGPGQIVAQGCPASRGNFGIDFHAFDAAPASWALSLFIRSTCLICTVAHVDAWKCVTFNAKVVKEWHHSITVSPFLEQCWLVAQCERWRRKGDHGVWDSASHNLVFTSIRSYRFWSWRATPGTNPAWVTRHPCVGIDREKGMLFM